MAFTIGTSANEIPHTLYYVGGAACILRVLMGTTTDTLSESGARGFIDRDMITFSGIPAFGATFRWQGVYCFSSSAFWAYSKDDRYGFFNDRHKL